MRKQNPPVHPTVCGLFDLDGSLVASEGHKSHAHRLTVQKFGGRLPDDFVPPVGSSFALSCRAAMHAGALRIDPNEYCAAYQQEYRGLMRTLTPVPGAIPLLRALRMRLVRCALVTSSRRDELRETIVTTRIWEYFQASVSADDVARVKPDPAPYLKALAALDARPEHCFVLEDTQPGVEAARSAGINVCAVRHAWNTGHDFSRAFAVFDNLEDTPRVLTTLLAAAGVA